MTQSKNLKLKLGLCGLALTSFLAINAHSTVHADTVDSGNANQNAITWDSDQDDSQVVKEDSEQDKASQSVQTQEASATQSVQSNVQNHAATSAVRVSNFDTSVVNRNSAQNARNNANVKVATVHDTAQMPVQKTKVAQFNQGSKIYTLNGSNQLSKNNGDGYVITNAGMYNGRAVDIGVTINGVQDNQGTYTTKWSNGDHADVTGKTDASFKYQNSVLAGTQQNNVAVPNQTRNRLENKEVTANSVDHTFYVGWNQFADEYTNVYASSYAISPKLLTDVMTYYDVDSYKAAAMILKAYARPDAGSVGYGGKAGDVTYISTSDPIYNAYSALTGELITDVNNLHDTHAGDGDVQHTERYWNGLDRAIRAYASYMKLSNNGNTLTDHNWLPTTIATGDNGPNFSGYGSANHYIGVLSEKDNKFDPQIISGDTNKYLRVDRIDVLGSKYQDPEHGTRWHLSKEAQDIFNGTNKYTIVKPVQVTDTLQLDQVNNGSLNYNYTVGLYDAQTGDLITDLKAEYKGKTGVQATASTSVMNNAIKDKIQQINQGKATVSYAGTSANDDVAFYQETRQVNPQSTDVNRKAQRVIHVTFPNAVKPASYDGIVDQNNNIVQTVTFTRTGTENIVSGQKTYGPWQQHGGFNAVTLPDIPGYTMTTTGV